MNTIKITIDLTSNVERAVDALFDTICNRMIFSEQYLNATLAIDNATPLWEKLNIITASLASFEYSGANRHFFSNALVSSQPSPNPKAIAIIVSRDGMRFPLKM